MQAVSCAFDHLGRRHSPAGASVHSTHIVLSLQSNMSASSSRLSEEATLSTSGHSETIRDPLRNNISPVVTDVISNAMNVISLLEAFSGMIPAPPFIEAICTLVKAIVKTVQVSISCAPRHAVRLVR